VVLFALEGTPEVAAAVEAVMKENWPGDSMDASQARHLNEALSARLKYYFAPGEIATQGVNGSKDVPGCMWGQPWVGVTGVISPERRQEMDHAQQGLHPRSRRERACTPRLLFMPLVFPQNSFSWPAPYRDPACFSPPYFSAGCLSLPSAPAIRRGSSALDHGLDLLRQNERPVGPLVDRAGHVGPLGASPGRLPAWR